MTPARKTRGSADQAGEPAATQQLQIITSLQPPSAAANGVAAPDALP